MKNKRWMAGVQRWATIIKKFIIKVSKYELEAVKA